MKTQISIYLLPEHLCKIDVLAKKQGISRSQMIRSLVINQIESIQHPSDYMLLQVDQHIDQWHNNYYDEHNNRLSYMASIDTRIKRLEKAIEDSIDEKAKLVRAENAK